MSAAAGCAAVAIAALVASGCSGKSGGPGVASLGASTTTTTSSSGAGSAGTAAGGAPPVRASALKMNAGLQFSRCMRAHGVPNFPDPGSGGGISITSGNGIDPNSSQFQSAQQACQKYLPVGKPPSPAQQAKMRATFLKFSACMRSHGVPSFPDPQFVGGGVRVGIKISPGGVDPNSPQFQQAQNACKQYLPGGGKGLQERTAGVGRATGGKATGGQ
jgi:hypothetical protein